MSTSTSPENIYLVVKSPTKRFHGTSRLFFLYFGPNSLVPQLIVSVTDLQIFVFDCLEDPEVFVCLSPLHKPWCITSSFYKKYQKKNQRIVPYLKYLCFIVLKWVKSLPHRCSLLCNFTIVHYQNFYHLLTSYSQTIPMVVVIPYTHLWRKH